MPDMGGIGRYTLELVQGMQSRLDPKALLFYRAGDWVADPAALMVRQKPALAARFAGRVRRTLRGRKVRASLPDLLFHGPNYFLPPNVVAGVATVHDLSALRFPEMHPPDRVAQFTKEFEASLSRARHLITDSEAVRQEVINVLGWPEDRVTSIPLGVDERFLIRAPDSLEPALSRLGLVAGRYLLCVSTIEPRKRLDALMTAYRQLPHRLQERYRLVIAGGKGWRSDALHDAIQRAQREGWLMYLGFVAEETLPALYSGARAFAFPSVYEGFGLPVLEAFASGAPVVTSNHASLSELASSAALLVDPDDPHALADALAQALEDESWRSVAVKQGLMIAARHTWAACCDRTLEIYRDVAQQLGVA